MKLTIEELNSIIESTSIDDAVIKEDHRRLLLSHAGKGKTSSYIYTTPMGTYTSASEAHEPYKDTMSLKVFASKCKKNIDGFNRTLKDGATKKEHAIDDRKKFGHTPTITDNMRKKASKRNSQYKYITPLGTFNSRLEMFEAYKGKGISEDRLGKWSKKGKNGFSRVLKDPSTCPPNNSIA